MLRITLHTIHLLQMLTPLLQMQRHLLQILIFVANNGHAFAVNAFSIIIMVVLNISQIPTNIFSYTMIDDTNY